MIFRNNPIILHILRILLAFRSSAD